MEEEHYYFEYFKNYNYMIRAKQETSEEHCRCKKGFELLALYRIMSNACPFKLKCNTTQNVLQISNGKQASR